MRSAALKLADRSRLATLLAEDLHTLCLRPCHIRCAHAASLPPVRGRSQHSRDGPRDELVHSRQRARLRAGRHAFAAEAKQQVFRASVTESSNHLSEEEEDHLQQTSLFQRSWNKLKDRLGSRILIPREIIWLNGPPGSGKGANLGFIKRIRGLSRSVTMSQMLADHAEAQAVIKEGRLVPDETVCDALLGQAFDPELADRAGLIVDGFPRSESQVAFIEDLYAHLRTLYSSTLHRPELRERYPKPSFKVVVLYVDEATSVNRQLARQAKSAEHNKKVLEAQAGTIIEERDTDKSVDKCRLRYAVFKRHYPALVRLQKLMPFSVIDATGSVEECEAQIAHELRYQSSLDLDERTYASITTLPLAREVVQHSRKALVSRLDDYCLLHTDTYGQVLEQIRKRVAPLLYKVAMSGFLEYESNAPLFEKNNVAVDIMIDVLTDRGFSVSYRRKLHTIPTRVELATGDIHTMRLWWHAFRITFPGGSVRDVKNLHSEASQQALAGAESPLLNITAEELMATQNDNEARGASPGGSQRAQNAALG